MFVRKTYHSWVPIFRNIAGYHYTVERNATPLPRAKFRWTSGGKQFYILYTIPHNADILTIQKLDLTIDEVLEALRDRLRAKKLLSGSDLAT